MNIIHSFRVVLIRLGKILPFIMCFIVALSYVENVFALAINDYLLYDDMIVPNKPISWFIGQYFEYNFQMLIVLCITSIAIETCFWNKLGCCYLGINLLEKSWFINHVYDNEIYITICLANLAIGFLIIYKGVKQLLKTK